MQHIDSGLTGVTFKRPSLVKPQFADDCDLGKIVARFIKTGELPNLLQRKPLAVQDITDLATDFGDIQNRRVQLLQAFEKLPEDERAKFQHSPEIWAEQMALAADRKETSSADPAPADPAPADPAPADPAPADPA